MINFKFHQRKNIATPIPEEIQSDAFAGPHHLYMSGEKILSTRTFNFLGITINRYLTWKDHTSLLQTKLSKNQGILHRLKNLLPFNALKMLYTTLIQSYLNYGIMAWGFNVGPLGVLQKKAIRAITHSKYNSHTEHTFKVLKILKVEDIFTLRCLKFYYNLKNNLVPHYFKTIFQPNHEHNTRQENTFLSQGSRTVGAERCLRHKIINIDANYDRKVIDKARSHSYDGYSNYAKNHLLESYITTCPTNGINCWVCNRPPWVPETPLTTQNEED